MAPGARAGGRGRGARARRPARGALGPRRQRRAEPPDARRGPRLALGRRAARVPGVRAPDRPGATRARLASDALVRHPEAARALVALFRARFDPALGARRAAALAEAQRALADARDPIASAAEDRVFGVLETLISATLRTSFFVPAQPERAARAGAEARLARDAAACPRRCRGSRSSCTRASWSASTCAADRSHAAACAGATACRSCARRSSALWKTQSVKNGLIVPVGREGRLRAASARRRIAREARAEADRLYARFVAALLRLTDDVRGERIVAPERVVRHDGDDPYLVVAADKGTAHLSDVANRVAAEPASGSATRSRAAAATATTTSARDHRARRVAVRAAPLRRARPRPEREAFTVVGHRRHVRRRVRKRAALDAAREARRGVRPPPRLPRPRADPRAALDRAQAAVRLPRSSWARLRARDARSAGGGVFERGAKRIALSAQARRVLGTDAEALSGDELIRAILRAPVDLLWNGGIGTYVKARASRTPRRATARTTACASTRASLRAGIVVEGGNLGLTQAARVELRARRRPHRHRRDPQLRRRRPLRPRGELQDPARAPLAGTSSLAGGGAQARCCAPASTSADAGRARAQREPEPVRCRSTCCARKRSRRSASRRRRRVPGRARRARRRARGPARSRALREHRERRRERGLDAPGARRSCSATRSGSCKRALASRRCPAHPSARADSCAATSRRCFASASRTSSRRTSSATRDHRARGREPRRRPRGRDARAGARARARRRGSGSAVRVARGRQSARRGSAARVRRASATPRRIACARASRSRDAVAQTAALALGLEGRALLEPDDAREARRTARRAARAARAPAPSCVARAGSGAPSRAARRRRSGAPVARALELWNELGERTRIAWLLDRLPEVELGDGWSRLRRRRRSRST